MSVYSVAGATLSEKNVKEEYLLNSDQLTQGIESGHLKPQWRSCHGNSYRLFIRSEVQEYVRLVGPDPQLKAAHDVSMMKQNLVSKRSRLQAVNAELSGIDARKAALVSEQKALSEWLLANDHQAAAQLAKAQAKAAKDEAKAAKDAAKAEKDAAKESKAASNLLKRKADDVA